MCGIVGIYRFKEKAEPGGIKKMADILIHRGRDDEGFLAVDFELGQAYPLTGKDSKVQGMRVDEFRRPVHLFLGHRRLSIIDLSPAGHQPMGNEDGSVWIVYNGEVYNYLEIRKELESLGHRFRSRTDTEVILHSYEEWGKECLKRFNGMWAFAILDLREKQIFCSRDRAGVKPFYYLYDEERFSFASEIKALLEIDGFSVEPNQQIIADYLFAGLRDHTQETFFKNIYQLRPGEYLVFQGNKLIVHSYWDIDMKEVHFSRQDDYVENFFDLFQDAIRLRLRSDVPIGTCLSGGLDSSSIVCMANQLMFDEQTIDRKLVGERQKTFSSCFENPLYDERDFIEKVIAQTGAEKHYVFPRVENVFKDLPHLIWHQEEPFGSTSMYAQWNVMKLAKEKGVTVLLDGQGGDELLVGYLPSFYFLFGDFLRRIKIRSFFKDLKTYRKIHPIPAKRILGGTASALFPFLMNPSVLGVFTQDYDWVKREFFKGYFRRIPKARKFNHMLNDYLYHQFRNTSLPALLQYEDRNSMAFSLETRLPFLDYRLVEYAFHLPLRKKILQGVTKVVLRDSMRGIVPEEIRKRMDKMGFVTPEDIWFRTVLREGIEEILNSKEFAERDYFDVPKLKQAFISHCEGKRNISFAIWRWVNLELWMRTFLDGRPSSGRLGRDDHTS
jgi:asparagine synthase (glutamine-hydrolysing)